jgi:archaetidylinositol phosphate synthase
MEHGSWTHLVARALMRPLVGGPITPNHLTTARLLTGLAACVAFTVGRPSWNGYGGGLWVVSAFLDRADGELARLGATTSASGHVYDYVCDTAVNSLFFVAIGVGLRESTLGGWAVLLGLIAGTAVSATSALAERLEQHRGGQAFQGMGRFDFDDVFYLFGPVAWFGWLLPLLVGTAVGAPVFGLWTWLRLRRDASLRPSRG